MRKLLRLVLALLFSHQVCWAQTQQPELPVVPPALLNGSEPAYPAGASGDATVVLELVVGADGAVRSATALAVQEPFSSEAEAAAKAWVFQPAQRGPRTIASRIRMEVAFHAPLPLEAPAASEAPAAPSAAAPAQPAPIAVPPPPPPVEIVVQGEAPEASRSSSLSRAEVRQLPGAFGDPFRAVEALPGVTPIVSGLPFFFVRGAPPGNVGYFVDELRLPLLFHVGAGPSVVHPALIGRVDLYPGGYPAELGRFSGGVVRGEAQPPSSTLHGEYNLRLFDAGAFVSAPLARNKADITLAGRYSFAGWLLSLFTNNLISYWDYQARLGYAATATDRLELFALGASDYIGQKTATQTRDLFRTSFHGVRASHVHRLNRGQLRTAFVLGTEKSGVASYGQVTDRLAAARSQLNLELAPTVELRAGTDLAVDRYQTTLDPSTLSPAAAQIAAAFSSRTDVAVGVYLDFPLQPLPRFRITPGLRVDLFGSEGAVAVGVDPRLQTRLSLSRRIALLGAFGVAHQPPAFATSAPGVQPGGLRGGLQRAIQESASVEAELDDATKLTTTAFYDAFMNMSDTLGALGGAGSGCPRGHFSSETLGGDPGGATASEAGDCGPRFRPGTLGPDASGGRGQAANTIEGTRAASAFEARTLGAAYGLEVFLKRRMTQRLSGLLSYTLSRSTRSQGKHRYVATFDRTHVLNVAASYALGRQWRVGSRVIFYSGVPAADVAADSMGRLPPFFRLDLRLEKRWQLGRQTWIAFVAEWLNATLSKEAIAARCTISGCTAETIGPITIPSIGVEGGF